MKNCELNDTIRESLESIDIRRLSMLIGHMGDKLNGHKDRFDKSDIIEKAMEIYSDGSIRHVDEIGYDHMCAEVAKLEVKSQKYCLYTEKTSKKKSKTSAIKLMNSLGDASKRKREDVIRFDALAIVDSDPLAPAVAYIMAKDIKSEWLKFEGDGVTVQIPTDSLVFICGKTEPPCLNEGKEFFDYKRRKDEFQRDYIQSF